MVAFVSCQKEDSKRGRVFVDLGDGYVHIEMSPSESIHVSRNYALTLEEFEVSLGDGLFSLVTVDGNEGGMHLSIDLNTEDNLRLYDLKDSVVMYSGPGVTIDIQFLSDGGRSEVVQILDGVLVVSYCRATKKLVFESVDAVYTEGVLNRHEVYVYVELLTVDDMSYVFGGNICSE